MNARLVPPATKGTKRCSVLSATSAQAVLISGLTVLVAMAGMLFAGSKIFTSIGVGAMLVVFTSLVGSLTVLPALLGKLGDRIDRGIRQVLAAGILRALRPLRIRPRWIVWLRDTPTLLKRIKGDRRESRVWAFVLRRSMRHPLPAVVLAPADYSSCSRCLRSRCTRSC